MLIIAYPRDDSFLRRASFAYQPDPRLAALDQVLDAARPRLLLRVSLDLMKSAPRAGETGHPSVPAEVTLRTAVVRRLQGWDYRDTQSEIAGTRKGRGSGVGFVGFTTIPCRTSPRCETERR